MVSVKKFDLNGAEVEQIEIKDALLESDVNAQMIKDYLIAIRRNKRQWSASTKGRKDVKCTGKKPHAQKGTGHARQGYLAAAQYRGGGIVFGPKPKFDQHVKINKKEKRAAILHMFCEKLREGKVSLLKFESMEAPKTKVVAQFLQNAQINGKRVLFLAESFGSTETYHNLAKSIDNIPLKNFLFMSNLSGYELSVNHELVMVESAFEELMHKLGEKA